MLMQEKRMRQVTHRLMNNELVISDFHPLKSRIFSQIVLQDKDRELISNLYTYLFEQQLQPELVIYLRTTMDTILSRIKGRGDEFTRNIDPDYIERLLVDYDNFFASYTGKLLVIDNLQLDYVNKQEDLQHVLELIKNASGVSI